MLELLTTVMLSIMAIASPTLPYDHHSYTAKASSFNDAVLRVEIVPDIANNENEDKPSPQAIIERNSGGVVADEIPDILKKISFCESGGKHFDENGQVIRGKENPNDIGKWQINLFYHYETAHKLGYDIFTEKGNEEYALWLYEKNGTKDWEYSRSCWKKT